MRYNPKLSDITRVFWASNAQISGIKRCLTLNFGRNRKMDARRRIGESEIFAVAHHSAVPELLYFKERGQPSHTFRPSQISAKIL